MRAFFHVSEYNNQGYKLLPSLLFLNTETVLWAPSALQLREYNRTNETFITPENLIELVQNGHVKIVGRETWFDKSDREENHKWPLAKWDDSFDSEIKQIAINDSSIGGDRRVIITGAERGKNKAKKFLSNQNNVNKISSLVPILKAENILAGTFEKVEREANEENKLQIIVRDIYNHYYAREEAFAGLGVEYPTMISAYKVLGLKPTVTKQADDVTSDKVLELFDFLKRFDKIKNYRELKHMLEEKRKLQKDITAVIGSSKPIVKVFEEGLIRSGDKNIFISKSKIAWDFVTLGGVVTSIASFNYSPLATIGVILSTLPIPFTLGSPRQMLRKAGILPIELEGNKFLNYLVFGKNKMSKHDLRDFSKKLLNT